MMSRNILNERIMMGLIERLPQNMYKCGCGKVLRKQSLAAHYLSRYHVEWETSSYSYKNLSNFSSPSKCTDTAVQDCDICMTECVESMRCPTCKKTLCTTCYQQWPHSCPYCRTVYIKYNKLPAGINDAFELELHRRYHECSTIYRSTIRDPRFDPESDARRQFCEHVVKRYAHVINHPKNHERRYQILSVMNEWQNDTRCPYNGELIHYYACLISTPYPYSATIDMLQ